MGICWSLWKISKNKQCILGLLAPPFGMLFSHLWVAAEFEKQYIGVHCAIPMGDVVLLFRKGVFSVQPEVHKTTQNSIYKQSCTRLANSSKLFRVRFHAKITIISCWWLIWISVSFILLLTRVKQEQSLHRIYLSFISNNIVFGRV